MFSLRLSHLIRSCALGVGLLISGCTTTPTTPQFANLNYAHLPPFQLSVERIDRVMAYQSPQIAPYVDHLFPTPLAQTLDRWLFERLRNVGAPGSAQLIATIEKAEVKEERLPISDGLSGYLKNEISENYHANIAVRIDVVDPAYGKTTDFTVKAALTRGVHEDITLNERRQVWFEMTETLMASFNQEMEKQINQRLKDYLR